MKLTLLVCVAVFGALVPALEINETHVFNPAWPAHARLHEVWQLSSNCLLAALCAWLAWKRDEVRTAALVALCITAGFLVAYAARAGYGGSMLGTDGAEKVVGGINVSAVAVFVMTAASACLAWIGFATRRDYPRNRRGDL